MAVEDFMDWFGPFLRDKGFRIVRCGFQINLGPDESHGIDLATGNWARESFSSSKPPRWLFHVAPTDNGLSVSPLGEGSRIIGYANTRTNDRAAIVIRVLPLIGTLESGFTYQDEFEIRALFVFSQGAPAGTSSEAFMFDTEAGILTYQNVPLQYAVSGLLGIQPRARSFTVELRGSSHTYTYGQIIDAVASKIVTRPDNGQRQSIVTFDLTADAGVEDLKRTVQGNWPEHDLAVDPDDDDAVIERPLQVPTNPDLIGIGQGVYRQINAALQSGKQHIMLYGPPGTGKTTLARWIAQSLTRDHWELITGSSDWSSQDIIGGYQPTGGGSVAFIPGVLLRNFDRPLIIDELNRCDIDKVIGPLFTVLSGQQTTLPYRFKIEDVGSPQYKILPESKPNPSEFEYSPGRAWRIIATINSIDKASLYQMSYALSRRFGWVYVDVPRDTRGFITEYLHKQNPSWGGPEADDNCPLGEFWSMVNNVRELGPAPIIDAIKIIQTMDSDATFFGAPSAPMRQYLLDAVDMVFLPLLDGITTPEGENICGAAEKSFSLVGDELERIRNRINSVMI